MVSETISKTGFSTSSSTVIDLPDLEVLAGDLPLDISLESDRSGFCPSFQREYSIDQDLLKDIQEIKSFDHTIALLASLRSEIHSAMNAYLGSSLGDTLQKAAESLSEYELKNILFEKMGKSRSYLTHDKHQALFDALLNSMSLDDAIALGQADPEKVLRKRDHDDEDPSAGPN
ncbi:hypothetical protein Tco_1360984 [Tanacetum coccineum]